MTLPRRTERLAVKALEAVLQRYVGREAGISTDHVLGAVQLVAALTGDDVEPGEEDGRMGFVLDHQGGSHDPYAVPGVDEGDEE